MDRKTFYELAPIAVRYNNKLAGAGFHFELTGEHTGLKLSDEYGNYIRFEKNNGFMYISFYSSEGPLDMDHELFQLYLESDQALRSLKREII